MTYRLSVAVALGLAFLFWSSSIASAPAEAGAAPRSPGATPHPGSVESLIDRREEQLQRRREDYIDWRSGRRWHQPPWINAHRDWLRTQETARAEAWRQRRDAREGWHDAIGRWQNPWSQWQEDWNRARRNAFALDRLNREEFVERRRYQHHPWAPFAPY